MLLRMRHSVSAAAHLRSSSGCCHCCSPEAACSKPQPRQRFQTNAMPFIGPPASGSMPMPHLRRELACWRLESPASTRIDMWSTSRGCCSLTLRVKCVVRALMMSWRCTPLRRTNRIISCCLTAPCHRLKHGSAPTARRWNALPERGMAMPAISPFMPVA
jgi:hypothetical protein